MTLEEIQAALDKIKKEVGDVSSVGGELTELQGNLDKAKQDLADIQKQVDAKANEQATEKQEAVTAIRAAISGLEELATSLS